MNLLLDDNLQMFDMVTYLSEKYESKGLLSVLDVAAGSSPHFTWIFTAVMEGSLQSRILLCRAVP